jgi:fumarate hydratase subunit alpha
MISETEFRKTIVEMLCSAETTLPKDVIKTLKRCRRRERDEIALLQFDCMFRNLELAQKLGVPICQDTGIPIFFVRLGSEVGLGFDLERTLKSAVKQATREVPLRPNVVDPLTRANPGTNVGSGQPAVHLELVPGRKLEVDILLKGAGTENLSRSYMLRPIDGVAAIERAILLTIAGAGGRPCPPTLVGVGIGGSAEVACLLAKKALLRPLGSRNPDKKLAKLEIRLTQRANELGIGPMGLGGRATVLGIHVAKAACHTASLPVAVNFQCWVARRASIKLIGNRLCMEVP